MQRTGAAADSRPYPRPSTHYGGERPMAGWLDLGNIWTTFKELDVRPIREQAERVVQIAVVGSAGAGKSTLIAAMRGDARSDAARARSHGASIGTAVEIDLDATARVGGADLIVLVLDVTRDDWRDQAPLVAGWQAAGRNLVVFLNKADAPGDAGVIGTAVGGWGGARVAVGSALDPDSLAGEFVPRVIEALPERLIALARGFPLFRSAVARRLIDDTSFANATYALGSGLAEVLPALDIPFNVADVVVLTKNQGLMSYKLGLALGLSPRWQDHVTQLGGVVGAGFMWRQVARQLVGLVPVWGIVPKVAVAYAGTYAIGEAILYWYRTGQKLTGRGMRQAYADALARGREAARGLVERAPRPRLPTPALRLSAPTAARYICPNCGRKNPRDARVCAYCAAPLPN
ncbi:MAG: zinc-ribbon domain-containing protein [Chloroflexi bacterium]|nr:zinc-ribbon domain-containing protein [Chloroflexota bacterium]